MVPMMHWDDRPTDPLIEMRRRILKQTTLKLVEFEHARSDKDRRNHRISIHGHTEVQTMNKINNNGAEHKFLRSVGVCLLMRGHKSRTFCSPFS